MTKYIIIGLLIWFFAAQVVVSWTGNVISLVLMGR